MGYSTTVKHAVREFRRGAGTSHLGMDTVATSN